MDIEIKVSIPEVFKLVARRTSMATETDPFYKDASTEKKQYSQLHGEGDRITLDFVKEAAKEVLKSYLSRQGDVTTPAFEVTTDEIIYRVAEGTPPLDSHHSDAVTARLTTNTRDAIMYFTMLQLYEADGNANKILETKAKTLELIDIISGDLYRLHD